MSDSRRRKPEEIEDEIYQARARLDETLHEIEERFSPQQLMNATYDYLRHGGAHEIADSLARVRRVERGIAYRVALRAPMSAAIFRMIAKERRSLIPCSKGAGETLLNMEVANERDR